MNFLRYLSTADTFSDGATVEQQADANGNTKITLATKIDKDIDSIAAFPGGHSVTSIAADTAVKSTAGVLHSVTFLCNDAAPTAGSIIGYDNTAESGTQIFNHTFTTTPFVPTTILLDATFATGLYVGFTTTADVNVTVTYR